MQRGSWGGCAGGHELGLGLDQCGHCGAATDARSEVVGDARLEDWGDCVETSFSVVSRKARWEVGSRAIGRGELGSRCAFRSVALK